MTGPDLLATRALDCARHHTLGQLEQLTTLAGDDLDLLLRASDAVKRTDACEPWQQHLAEALLMAAHISATAQTQRA